MGLLVTHDLVDSTWENPPESRDRESCGREKDQFLAKPGLGMFVHSRVLFTV